MVISSSGFFGLCVDNVMAFKNTRKKAPKISTTGKKLIGGLYLGPGLANNMHNGKLAQHQPFAHNKSRIVKICSHIDIQTIRIYLKSSKIFKFRWMYFRGEICTTTETQIIAHLKSVHI